MLQVCTRIGILYAGRLMETAPAGVLLRTPQHPYTQGLMSCFLEVHQKKTARQGIPGAPADLRNPPAGCRFHPRCAFVMDRLPRRTAPVLRRASRTRERLPRSRSRAPVLTRPARLGPQVT